MTSKVTIAMAPETSTFLDVPGSEGSALDQQEFAVGIGGKKTIALVQASDLAQLSDETLLFRYFMGSSQRSRTFEILTERYGGELFAYLHHYLGNAEMAEDALQQTFLRVHLKCDTFEFDGKKKRKFRPWLYTIATNQAIDLQRRNRRHKMVSLDKPGCLSDGQTDDSCSGLGNLVLDDSLGDPLDGLVTDEQSAEVQQAVNELPEALRQVVLLVYYQRLKYREAADALGIPIGTVKFRLHTALGRLGIELTGQAPEISAV